MPDVFDNIVICNSCRKKTVKGETVKDGFVIRVWKCPSCKQIWPHPGDWEKYQDFKKIRDKNFSVKLRMVGNSYTISIPREIITFHQVQRDELVRLAMEDPDKVVLYFSRMAKFIKQ